MERRMKVRPAMIAAALASLAAPAGAQPPPRKLELSYSGVLNALHLTGDVKVVDLHVVEHAGAGHFETRAEMHSYGVLRAFKQIDVRTAATGPVDVGLPRGQTFEIVEARKQGEKRTTLTWARDQVIRQPPRGPFGDPPPTMAQELAASDPVTQLSRIAYAPSGGAICGHSWRFFDSVQLYDIALAPVAADQPTGRERSMGVTEAVQCTAGFSEVAGFKHRHGEPKNTGLRSAVTVRFGRLGVAGPWIGLSMKADTLLGYGKVQLDAVRVGPG
jgi:hypothetical protein